MVDVGPWAENRCEKITKKHLLRCLYARTHGPILLYGNRSRGEATQDLCNLEALLLANGYKPIYVDLTHRDTGISVCRAIVPGLEMMTFFDRFTPLGLRQFAHYQEAFSD